MPGKKSDMQHTAMTIEHCLQHCSTPDLQNLLRVAAAAAVKAGALLQELYDQPHQIRHKGPIDLVTEADLAAEELILDVLRDTLPEIKILSEESFASYEKIPEEPVWIIDPLDGTTNFAHNFPWFAVSIAFYDRGKSQIGVIYSPIQKELFCATRTGGAWLNEGVRRPGAAALDLAYLACGRLDAFWEIGLKPWDTAAGYLLVEEAGGALSNFNGSPFSPFIPELLASNTFLHRDLTALLHGFSTVAPCV